MYSGVLLLLIPLCKENDCSLGFSYKVYKNQISILAKKNVSFCDNLFFLWHLSRTVFVSSLVYSFFEEVKLEYTTREVSSML